MKIHPLLLPHLIDMHPEQIAQILAGRRPGLASYWGRIGAVIDDEAQLLLPEKIGDHAFTWHGLLWQTRVFPEKLKNALIGKGLDLFADLPLAHRCPITGFTERAIEFGHEDEAMPFSKLPRHTEESHKARSRRRGLEVFAEVKLHWMSLRLIDMIPPEKWQDLAFDQVDDGDSALGIDGETLGDPSIISLAIPTDGTAPTILFKGARILAGTLTLPVGLPQSMRAGLPGSEARRILDHPLLEGISVLREDSSDAGTKVTFASPGRTRSLALDRAETVAHELQRAKDEEEALLPREIQEWDMYLQEKDAERDTDPSRHVLSCHKHVTRDGKTRVRPSKRRTT